MVFPNTKPVLADACQMQTRGKLLKQSLKARVRVLRGVHVLFVWKKGAIT